MIMSLVHGAFPWLAQWASSLASLRPAWQPSATTWVTGLQWDNTSTQSPLKRQSNHILWIYHTWTSKTGGQAYYRKLEKQENDSQVLRGAVLVKKPSFSGFLKYWSSGKKSRLQFKVIGVYNLAWTPGWSVRTGEDPSPRPLSPHLHTTGCQQRGQVCCGGELFRSHVATQK